MIKNSKREMIAILSCSLLIQGVVGVGSGLQVIGAHFSDVPQTSIQLLVSLPSVLIIFATIAAGKLQEYISKRTIAYIGILLFFVSGIAPAFMKSFPLILVMRALFGIGVGFIQPMASALIEYFFSGEKRDRMMGWQASTQMMGTAIMSFLGGQLASRAWNLTFLVYGVAILPLILVPLLLPKMKAARKEAAELGEKVKVVITKGAIGWAIVEFIYFIVGQVNAIYNAYLIAEKGIGTPADLGAASLFSTFSGLMVGIFYGKLRKKTGHTTYALGCFLLVLGDLAIAFAPSMLFFCISGLLAGAAFGICIPSMLIGVASSVNKYSASMAFAIAMCSKSVAQFLCAYIMNPIITFCAAHSNIGKNQWAYIISAGYLLIFGTVMLIYGIRKNRSERKTNIANLA